MSLIFFSFEFLFLVIKFFVLIFVIMAAIYFVLLLGAAIIDSMNDQIREEYERGEGDLYRRDMARDQKEVLEETKQKRNSKGKGGKHGV